VLPPNFYGGDIRRPTFIAPKFIALKFVAPKAKPLELLEFKGFAGLLA
jgi:hypothetical protein